MRVTSSLLIFTLMLSPVSAHSQEKLANPFDVRIAAAKQGEFGVAIDLSAGVTVKKVKRKIISSYHPINITISDFKIYDSNYDYRGEIIGHVPRYGYSVTVKNFSKSEEIVGIYTQLWCRNINNGGNYNEGFDGYPSLPPRTESSGTSIVRLPTGVNSLAECEQALIYIFPNYSFTKAQLKGSKFATSIAIPIDLTLLPS